MGADGFFDYLEGYFIQKNNCQIRRFDGQDKKNIDFLAGSRYKTSEFIYGANLKYSFENKKRFGFGTVEVRFNVLDSKINGTKICGDFFGEDEIQELEKHFDGLPHDFALIKEKIENIGADIGKFIKGCDAEKLFSVFI
jgi:hypothetical protein